jgi:hypothetical protein
MQSITVQYLPATNHRPTRLKAKCAGGSITVPLDYSIDDRDYLVERTVALALIAKMNWGQQVRITGAGRDYRGDVVFTLGNIETDNTSKRDRIIERYRTSVDLGGVRVSPVKYHTRPSMLDDLPAGVIVLDELAPVGGDK